MPIKAGSIDQRYEIYPESNSFNKNSATLIKDDNKHVTWGNNITFNIEERNETDKTTSTIFSKLKIRKFEKPEPVSKDNNESNDNNDELMQIIKNLQEDVGNLKDNLKNINTILGQLLEKN
jgi:isocitrate dehydrogenase kinase/phosphatase